MSMTGRERMRLAMRRQCPDRVPTMPQLCHPHAVHVFREDYRQGIAETIEQPQLRHELTLELAQHYGVDGLRLFCLPDPMDVVDDGQDMVAVSRETGERVGRVDLHGGGHVVPDQRQLPVETAEDLSKLPKVRCEALLETSALEGLQDATARAHQAGRFVASAPPGFTMNYVSDRRGRQRALMDLMTEPDLVKQIMDVALANAIEHARALVECGVDALYIGDPSSSASLISPQHFEEFCLPRFRLLCEELHKSGILIYIHICGNSKPSLEMMADTGADCIEPLDPLGGVDVADAERRVGGRVALMGGVNTLTLQEGTPEAVYEESLACCRAGGSQGGYILAAGDMVPDLAPEANVRAMVAAAKDCQYDGGTLVST